MTHAGGLIFNGRSLLNVLWGAKLLAVPPNPLKQYCFKKKGIPLCFLSCRISASIYWARSQGIKVLLVVHCEAAGSAVRDRQRRARELCRTRRNAAALKGDEGLLPATKAGACRTGRV